MPLTPRGTLTPSQQRQTAAVLNALHHPTLSAYYPRLIPLRQYLYETGVAIQSAAGTAYDGEQLENLLDGAVVGLSAEQVELMRAGNIYSAYKPEVFLMQQEAVDQIISSIFKRNERRYKRPLQMNVLTIGFRRSGEEHAPNPDRRGVDTFLINSQVTAIRSESAWRALHQSIGTELFITVLSTLCIFMPLPNNCYYQLSGLPLCQTKSLKEANKELHNLGRKGQEKRSEGVLCTKAGVELRAPVDVKIVRNRMFYGKWVGFKAGKRPPCCGLPQIHILNSLKVPPPRHTLPGLEDPRYAELTTSYDHHQEARQLLRYVFPREHGLRNAFEIRGEERDWAGRVPFYRDFTDRSLEIMNAMDSKGAKTPKRLKGETIAMMDQLIKNHRKCDYWKLRAVCCPSKIRGNSVESTTDSLSKSFITPHKNVVRYARAVCGAVFPPNFWGNEHNRNLIYGHIASFTTSRRFESASVHQVLQGFEIDSFSWLQAGPSQTRVPSSESKKRRQLLEEIVYWFFDSFLISLLKNTFYVTETAVTKYATTYYRLDDWDRLCRPKYNQLVKMNLTRLSKVRQSTIHRNPVPHTTLRLLPKKGGLRPISNLRKKLRKTTQSGAVYFSKSINEELDGSFHALTFEKTRHPDLLASSMFGMYDLYPRLKDYKRRLIDMHGAVPKLYFAKVDVEKAFDSIKPNKMMEVLREVLERSDDYHTASYCKMLPPTGRAPMLWAKRAMPSNEVKSFSKATKGFATQMQNAIFIDQVSETRDTKAQIYDTLHDHVRGRLVRIGNTYYGQKVGIAQGSKVSSLLCSFYYGHMERETLSFTAREDSLLVRIIDDFLFISTQPDKVERFLVRMATSQAEYGCSVSAAKSLVNFPIDVSALDTEVPLLDAGEAFPYCGMLIDQHTLDVHIDVSRGYNLHVRNALTVKKTTKQGSGFAKWLKRMLENHNHIIYNDTSLSSYQTVCSNIYTNFLLTAMKTVHYLRALQYDDALRGDFALHAVDDAIWHTCNANRAHVKSQLGVRQQAECAVDRQTFVWIAKHAFHRVFCMKPTGLKALIKPLKMDLANEPRAISRSTRSKKVGKTTGMDRKGLELILDGVWEGVKRVPW